MAFFDLFRKAERIPLEVPVKNQDFTLDRRESALSAIVLRYPGLVDKPSLWGEFVDRAWRATFQKNPALSESEALEKVVEMVHARILLVQGQNAAYSRAEEEPTRQKAALALKNREAEKAARKRRAQEEGRWISDEVPAPSPDVIIVRRESALSGIVLRYPGLVDEPSVYGEFADRAWRATFKRNFGISESEALEKVLEMLRARILIEQGGKTAAQRVEEESARKSAAVLSVALKNQEAEKAARKRRAQEEGRWISDEVPAPSSDVITVRRESALSEVYLRYPGLVDMPSVDGEFVDRAWRATFKRNPALSESEALEKVVEMVHARILLFQGQYTASLRAEEKAAQKRAAAALEKVKSDRLAAKLRTEEESQAIADEQRWLNIPLERVKAQKEDAEWRAGAPKRKAAAEKSEAVRKRKVEADQQAYAEWCRKNRPEPFHITDWEKAEQNAEKWMRFMGFVDARQTGAGADGGIDVVATGAAAQVKREAYDVGSRVLNAFKGAAHEYDVHLFFASAGYTKQAVAFANDVKMELYLVGPYGEVTGVNQAALDRLERTIELGRAMP